MSLCFEARNPTEFDSFAAFDEISSIFSEAFGTDQSNKNTLEKEQEIATNLDPEFCKIYKREKNEKISCIHENIEDFRLRIKFLKEKLENKSYFDGQYLIKEKMEMIYKDIISKDPNYFIDRNNKITEICRSYIDVVETYSKNKWKLPKWVNDYIVSD